MSEPTQSESFNFADVQAAIDLGSAGINPLELSLEVQDDLDGERNSDALPEVTIDTHSFEELEEAVRNASKGVNDDTDKTYMW